jgi:fumarate reductase subunit D
MQLVAQQKRLANPFYVLLVIAGVAFGITACAYVLMIVVMKDPSQAAAVRDSGEGLIHFMDKHGLRVMIVEIIVLAVATFAAIATDGYWNRSAEEGTKR